MSLFLKSMIIGYWWMIPLVNLTLLVTGSKSPLCHRGGWIPPTFNFESCSAHRPPTEMGQYSMERPCPDDSKKYRLISVGCLWAEQFAIKIDWFFQRFSNFAFSWILEFLINFENRSISIANCSAHRHPTEMSLYFLESSGQWDSKKYRLIFVGGLWAEQFAIKHCPILRRIFERHQIFEGGLGGNPQKFENPKWV